MVGLFASQDCYQNANEKTPNNLYDSMVDVIIFIWKAPTENTFAFKNDKELQS